MKNFNIILVLLLIVFFSCDVIKDPVQENTDNTCGDESTGVPIKKILIEDFTGQRCLNCPDAAEILKGIMEDYCDHIVPIAVHCTVFADSSAEFPYNYHTEVGDELAEDLGIISLPIGTVNRTMYNGNLLLSRDSWLAAVNTLYNLTPEVNILMESSYNEATHQVTTVVTTEILSDLNEEINLGLYITEDSIISPQQDGADFIENYVHRHMLRKGITSTYGEKIASSGQLGDIFTKTFVFNVDPKWDINHCELVAFVSKSSSNEILQAESEPVLEE
jgi:hypothetical protein